MLIGNKVDLDHKREVTKQVAENLASEHGMKYMETSALENINVA